jgi:uncharacterized membrane protein (Fun14 family)
MYEGERVRELAMTMTMSFGSRLELLGLGRVFGYVIFAREVFVAVVIIVMCRLYKSIYTCIYCWLSVVIHFF